MSKKRCNCINVEIGSYNNSVVLQKPFGSRGLVSIDKCIASEVQMLWEIGIETTGCCCGHNKVDAYIGVIDRDIPIMKRMGYAVAHNRTRPNDEDSFYPKYVSTKP